jgi:hypothetical protein
VLAGAWDGRGEDGGRTNLCGGIYSGVEEGLHAHGVQAVFFEEVDDVELVPGNKQVASTYQTGAWRAHNASGLIKQHTGI